MTSKENEKRQLSEAEFGEIDKAAKALGYKFAFGYFSAEDIEQEVWKEALKVLPKWDGKRSLSAFIYSHGRNRLNNLKRDILKRTELPCKNCPGFCGSCGYDTSPQNPECVKRMTRLEETNMAKQNIMYPLDICNVNDEDEPNMLCQDNVANGVELDEISLLLDRLSPEMRKIYQKIIGGQHVSQTKKTQLREAILTLRDEGGETHE